MNKIVTFLTTMILATLCLDRLLIEDPQSNFILRMKKWEDIQEGYYSKFLSGMTY